MGFDSGVFSLSAVSFDSSDYCGSLASIFELLDDDGTGFITLLKI